RKTAGQASLGPAPGARQQPAPLVVPACRNFSRLRDPPTYQVPGRVSPPFQFGASCAALEGNAAIPASRACNDLRFRLMFTQALIKRSPLMATKIAWLCLAAILPLTAVRAADAPSKKEMAALQGTWQLQSLESNGKVRELPDKPPKWVIKGNKVLY